MNEKLLTTLLTLLSLVCLALKPGSASAQENDSIANKAKVDPAISESESLLEQSWIAQGAKKRVRKSTTNTTTLYFYYWTYDFEYDTTDQFGKPIRISARLFWNKTNKKVLLYCPFTHFTNAESATSDGGFTDHITENTYTGDYVMVLIDGQGFGITKDSTQLYLNHEVWAKQEFDGLKRAYELIKLKDINLAETGKTIIAGSSQGAGTALATLRYMETTKNDEGKTLADEYNVDFVNLCCGPYDPVLTVKTYFTEWYRLTYPCVIPMTIKSMMRSYPDIMAGVKEEDFYTEEYLKIKDQIDAAIASKEKSADDINDIFFTNFCHSQKILSEVSGDLLNVMKIFSTGIDQNGGVYVTEFLRPDVIDMSSVAAKKLIQCLERNNILDGEWTPQHFIRYQYSTEDQVVPYANTKELERYLTKANSTSKNTENGHVPSCGAWTLFDSLTSRDW